LLQKTIFNVRISLNLWFYTNKNVFYLTKGLVKSLKKNIKVRGFIVWTTVFFSLLPFYAQEAVLPKIIENAVKIKTVVIDAGHGGKDSGALGSKTKEKDIALKIALKVGDYIKTYIPSVKVVYTRKTDKFIPLYERAEIANNYKADVFISIHCNALPKKKKYIAGTETYVMGLHTAEENLLVAKRENQVVLLENDYAKRYDGFDPNSPEAHIMLSMYQNAHLEQSILLAQKVEAQFKTRAKRASRGVKQAGFVVLKATSMPSILVETGFLSNQGEETYLNSEKGQVYLASAIYRAFKEYRAVTEKIPYQHRSQSTAKSKKKITGKRSIHFSVQLASSSSKLNTKTGKLKKIKAIKEVYVAGAYKYVTGNFGSMEIAVKEQQYWRKNGFSDAFVVAFENGQRISLTKAKALLKK